jgi:hypothetical protein
LSAIALHVVGADLRAYRNNNYPADRSPIFNQAPPRVVGLRSPARVLRFFSILHALAQDQSYHRFANQRTLLVIPNFWNVVSNVLFIAARRQHRSRPFIVGSLKHDNVRASLRKGRKTNDADHFRNGRGCFDFRGHSGNFTGRTDRAVGRRRGRPQQFDAGVVGSSVLARPLGPPALPTGMVVISLLSRQDALYALPLLHQLSAKTREFGVAD